MKNLLFTLIALSILLFGSCKKDSVDEEEFQATKIQLIEKLEKVDVPEVMKTSSNPNAGQAIAYVDQIKNISSNFTYFDIPEDATYSNAGGNEYAWGAAGFSVWQNYSETSSAYEWVVDIDAGAGRNTYIKSEESKDGTSGKMEIFDYLNVDGDLLYTLSWEFDANDNASLVYEFVGFKYEVNSNADLSGSSYTYTDGVKMSGFTWNSDGSGTSTYYDSDGAEMMSESWTADDL